MEIKEATSQENFLKEIAEERGLLPEELNVNIVDKQRPKICTEFKVIAENGLLRWIFSDKAVVILSDNSRWTINKEGKGLEVVERIKKWQFGDDIRIKCKSVRYQEYDYRSKDVFLLHNVRTSETIPFFDQDFEFLLANVTTTLTKISPSGDTAQTSDGRVWSTRQVFNQLSAIFFLTTNPLFYFLTCFNCFNKEAQENHKVIVNQGEGTQNNYVIIDPNHRTIGHPLFETYVTEQFICS